MCILAKTEICHFINYSSLPGENYPHCSEVCNAENKAVKCDLCDIWMHAECKGIPSECYDNFNSLFSQVHNISYYCEVNLCNSRIKQLIHNHHNDLEKLSDLPSLRSLQAEQRNLHRLISEMSIKLDDLRTQRTAPNNEPLLELLQTEHQLQSPHGIQIMKVSALLFPLFKIRLMVCGLTMNNCKNWNSFVRWLSLDNFPILNYQV